MEAAKNGTIPQHVSELISQYNDSMNKLNQIKMASPDTLQLVANIYNESVQEQKKPGSVGSPSSNVFSLSNAAATAQQNPFQLGNVFGGTQQAPMNAGSIFGGSSVTSNPFQSSAQNSIFGGPKEQAAPPSSAFSFSLGQQAPQQSVFGSVQQQPAQSSIFGSSQPIQQQPASSIFGAQNVFGSNSIFAASPPQPQLQTQQSQPGSSIFGQSIFSQAAVPTQPIFGSPPQQQQQQLSQQSSVFAQPSGNIFGSYQAQPDPPAKNMFVQSQAMPSQNVFTMQQTASAPVAPTGSIFQIQQPTANPQQTFGGNPFQTQPPQIDDRFYSKPEDLTPDEIAAFEADTFIIGKIPVKPPPKYLCN